MASTNKTTNFGLNQWVGTDPVLREDFNNDNEILDEVLKPVPYMCFYKLKTFEIQESTNLFSLSVSDIDLTKYWDLYLTAEMGVSATSDIQLLINGATSGYYIPATSSSGSRASYMSQINLSVYQDNVTRFHFEIPSSYNGTSSSYILCRTSHHAGTSTTDRKYYDTTACLWKSSSKVNTIDFKNVTTGATIQSGSKFTLYGLTR